MKKLFFALAIVSLLATSAMADRTWSAKSLNLPTQFCASKADDGTTKFQKPYAYLDTNGDPLPIPAQSVVIEVDWDSLPENVKTAMAAINTYLNNAAYAQEPDITAP